MFALKSRHIAVMALICLGAMQLQCASAAPGGAPISLQESEQVYAVVNGKAISVNEFAMLYASTMRQRYYHGRMSEEQAVTLRDDVTVLVVERALQLDEAEKRGLAPEAEKIDLAVAEYDNRYGQSEAWQEAREQVLPVIRQQLTQQNLLEQLDKLQRTVASPSAEDVRSYYQEHQDLFTEPEKLHVSAILLNVDPSSGNEVWEKTRQDAQELFSRLTKGEDFAELARKHSGDPSASEGGDLGYIHRGMLPDALHDKIDKMSPGDISEPMDMLQGIALFRLEAREPSRLREFGDVELRARDLLVRELEEQAKKDALALLHKEASIEIFAASISNDSNPPPVAEEGGDAAVEESGDGELDL